MTNSAQATARPRNMKFVTCYTIFYFQDQIIDTDLKKNRYAVICDYLLAFAISVRDENPSSVVFISFRTSSPSLSWEYYSCLQNVHLTSLFYRFSTHRADCIYQNYKIPISLYVAAHSKWDTNRVNSFYACAVSIERLTSERFIHPQKCLFRVAKQILNMTEKEALDAYGKPSFLYLNHFAEKYKVQKTHSRFELVPYGSVVELYQFGTTVRPLFYRINSLIEPFEMTTWGLLVGSICCLCLYFRVLFKWTRKRFLLETHVLSILLEQSQNIATKFKRLEKQASVLLVCWLFLTFLVGNAYKGVLFTLLTKPSVPLVPQTLQQVILKFYIRYIYLLKTQNKHQCPG